MGHEGLEDSEDPLDGADLLGNKGDRESSSYGQNEPKCANAGSVTIATVTAPDPIEAALAKALEGATAAGEWSTVAQLARELEARRKARAEVVDLAAERARRNGGAL